jgi:hypothetical protein
MQSQLGASRDKSLKYSWHGYLPTNAWPNSFGVCQSSDFNCVASCGCVDVSTIVGVAIVSNAFGACLVARFQLRRDWSSDFNCIVTGRPISIAWRAAVSFM